MRGREFAQVRRTYFAWSARHTLVVLMLTLLPLLAGVLLLARDRAWWRGVVAAGAELTVGVMEAVGALAVDVPGQLSVVGFGDAPWFRWRRPALTTVALPVYELAYACGGHLIRQIERRDGPAGERGPPYRAIHRPTLIVRASTADV